MHCIIVSGRSVLSISVVRCNSLELVRLCHSRHISSDMYMTAMSCDGTVAAKPRTIALNEELGQIRFILSDKTGTLTQVLHVCLVQSLYTYMIMHMYAKKFFLIASVTHWETTAMKLCMAMFFNKKSLQGYY